MSFAPLSRATYLPTHLLAGWLRHDTIAEHSDGALQDSNYVVRLYRTCRVIPIYVVHSLLRPLSIVKDTHACNVCVRMQRSRSR